MTPTISKYFSEKFNPPPPPPSPQFTFTNYTFQRGRIKEAFFTINMNINAVGAYKPQKNEIQGKICKADQIRPWTLSAKNRFSSPLLFN